MKATNQESISSRGRVFALASLFVVGMISALANTAHADALARPTNPVAHEHVKTGNRYYRVREFEKAIEEYKAGAVREDAPVFYYNLGQCYRNLGRYEEAIWQYERFLDRGKPTGKLEASVKKFIAQMNDELEKKAMKQPPAEPAPPPPPDSASPGQMLPASLPPAEPRRGMPLQQKIAIGVGTAGAATVALGIVLGLRARSFQEDADEVCPTSPCAGRADEANELIDRGKMSARYANVAFGVGGAAIVGATVLWITGSPTEHKNTAIVPQVSRSFTGIAAGLRF